LQNEANEHYATLPFVIFLDLLYSWRYAIGYIWIYDMLEQRKHY